MLVRYFARAKIFEVANNYSRKFSLQKTDSSTSNFYVSFPYSRIFRPVNTLIYVRYFIWRPVPHWLVSDNTIHLSHKFTCHIWSFEPDILISIHGLAPGQSHTFAKVENIFERGLFIICIHGWCLVRCTSMIPGNSQNDWVLLRGGLVISLRGSVPWFSHEATSAYHLNGCG